MILAKIRVTEAHALPVYVKPIPQGIIGGKIEIEYTHPMWDSLTKIVVFQGAVTKDVESDGNLVTIPAEVVAKAGVTLRVGVYGLDANNNIAIPTIWDCAGLGRVKAAADPSGDPAADPTMPIWAQLLAEVEELKKQGASDEQISQAVSDYLAENPVQAGATPEQAEQIRENTAAIQQLQQNGVYYIATDHGVRPDVEDNTAAMQNLIDKVHENGGGIIWMPVGEYRFDSSKTTPVSGDFRMCLVPKSGVSIVGESLTGTVIKVYGHTERGAAWMANLVDYNSDEVALFGFTYQNFTIDMSEATIDEFTSTGKALGMKAIRNCIFRDLRLIETPATALGIDMLDNVVIDSVYIYRGGREWSYGEAGGAGIGIGTGKWSNENYIIRNCICDSCGHFGIFLEDQGLFKSQPTRSYPKGQIITNNIIRNGRHYGIGIRGGKNVSITGNNIYENYGGIYLDYGAKNVMISGNVITESTEAGVMFGNEDASGNFAGFACENVDVFGNSFFGNTTNVLTLNEPSNCHVENNINIDNRTGFYTGKKLIAFGQSVVSGCDADEDGGFLNYIQNACGFAECVNAGVSGIAMVDTANGEGINKRIKARTDLNNYDVILLESGLNEFLLEAPVGLVTGTNDSIYSGSLNDAVEYLQTNYPNAEIILITPTQTKRNNAMSGEPDGKFWMDYINAVDRKQEDYVNMCIRIGNRHGIPVADLYHNSGITPRNSLTYLEADGKNLNAKGYKKIGRKVLGVLESQHGTVLNSEAPDTHVRINNAMYDISNSTHIEYRMILNLGGTLYLYASHFPFWFYENEDGSFCEVFVQNMTNRAAEDKENKNFPSTSMLVSDMQVGTVFSFSYVKYASNRSLDCIVAANFNVRKWGTDEMLFYKNFN